MHKFYQSRAVLASFEGAGAADAGAGAGAGTGDARFTQDDVNRMLADDRRKHQAKLDQVQRTLTETLEGKNLSVRERESLAAQVETLAAEKRTREEQLVHEKTQMEKQYGKQLADSNKALADAQALYHSEKTERALTDAASGNDAFRPEQVVTVLRPYTRLEPIKDEKGKIVGQKVLIDFPDTDEDGQPTKVVHTPESAVRRMRELPKKYGNLFNSGVVSGIGSQATAGGPGGGPIDPRKLTQAQYLKIRAERPELLGLRPLKAKH
jgi:hypothetical protein